MADGEIVGMPGFAVAALGFLGIPLNEISGIDHFAHGLFERLAHLIQCIFPMNKTNVPRLRVDPKLQVTGSCLDIVLLMFRK